MPLDVQLSLQYGSAVHSLQHVVWLVCSRDEITGLPAAPAHRLSETRKPPPNKGLVALLSEREGTGFRPVLELCPASSIASSIAVGGVNRCMILAAPDLDHGRDAAGLQLYAVDPCIILRSCRQRVISHGGCRGPRVSRQHASCGDNVTNYPVPRLDGWG